MTFEEFIRANPGNFTEQPLRLYNDLLHAGVTITFEIGDIENNWSARVVSAPEKTYLIISGGIQAKPNWMMHELQHVQHYSQGFLSPEEIDRIYSGFNSIFGRLDDSLTVEITNILGHLRMIDTFIEEGYDIDEFLRQTPEQHFKDEIEKGLECLAKLHEENCLNICRFARRAIIYCGTALVNKGRSHTERHEITVNPLLAINRPLTEGIIHLYEEWMAQPDYNNRIFFDKLDKLMKTHRVPNYVDCEPENNDLIARICFYDLDLPSLF